MITQCQQRVMDTATNKIVAGQDQHKLKVAQTLRKKLLCSI